MDIGSSIVALVIAFIVLFSVLASAETPTQRVGLPLLLEDVYLEGPLLEPIPRKDREIPVVVRLVETKPAQDGFRYTFEVQGLDPGDYNLGDYLREEAAEAKISSVSFPFRIITELPAGLPAPTALAPRQLPRIGGYRTLIWILAILWLAGLAWLFFSSRKKTARIVSEELPASLATRLEPLLRKASRGEFTTEEQASLERLILAHWREHVPEVAHLPAAKSLAVLREHSEASPLLLKLEHWLHAPESQVSTSEIDSLLEPYRN